MFRDPIHIDSNTIGQCLHLQGFHGDGLLLPFDELKDIGVGRIDLLAVIFDAFIQMSVMYGIAIK